jgi:DNA-binding Lrp family transcriptional regulator
MRTQAAADAIDARLLFKLARDPRATVMALAEAAGVSRNTVQARINKWNQSQAILGFDRCIDPSFLGYPLRAVVLTQVRQRFLDEVSSSLAMVPEVVEVCGLSGSVDLIVHVVARDADDLYRIAGKVLDIKGVRRTTTSLVMRTLVEYRISQLIRPES